MQDYSYKIKPNIDFELYLASSRNKYEINPNQLYVARVLHNILCDVITGMEEYENCVDPAISVEEVLKANPLVIAISYVNIINNIDKIISDEFNPYSDWVCLTLAQLIYRGTRRLSMYEGFKHGEITEARLTQKIEKINYPISTHQVIGVSLEFNGISNLTPQDQKNLEDNIRLVIREVLQFRRYSRAYIDGKSQLDALRFIMDTMPVNIEDRQYTLTSLEKHLIRHGTPEVRELLSLFSRQMKNPNLTLAKLCVSRQLAILVYEAYKDSINDYEINYKDLTLILKHLAQI